MKYKIKNIVEGGDPKQVSDGDKAKALLSYEEYTGPEIEILGVPFGGHIVDLRGVEDSELEGLTPEEIKQTFGRDSYGEYFHSETDIMMAVGEETRLTYYHGFGPDEPYSWQEPPVVIGRARLSRVDAKGYWFTAKLDADEALAKRISGALDSGSTVRASSGAVGHMVRMKGDAIEVWPVGELAVFDTNEWRLPANDLAEVSAKSVVPQVETGQGDSLKAQAKNEPRAEEDTGVDIDLLDDEPAVIADEQIEGTINMDIDEVKSSVDVILAAFKTSLADITKEMTEKAVAGIKAAQTEVAYSGGVLYQEAPKVKKVTELGFSDEPIKAFQHYLRTGDNSVRAALQEDTDGEGGYLVPDDFYAQIIEKRDEMSIARAAGASVITTDLKVVNVPVENAKLANFAIVAEEGAANQNEPTFGQVAITAYKFNKLIKVSDELVADEKANLMPYLSKAFGRAMALTENNYFLVGTGSSQPQGAVVGSTLGVTAAGAAAITAAEIMQLYYKLKEYRDSGVWTMAGDTEAALRSIQGNPFVFGQTPSATGLDVDTLQGKRVYNSASMPAMTTGLKSVLFGNWEYYGIVERAGMSVRRLNELYAANGQVGLLATFRVGGAVLQAEAFQHLIQA